MEVDPAVRLVLRAEAKVGEGPLWDFRSNVLWWVDIEAGKLNRFDPERRVNDVFEMGQRVGTVVLRASGGLLLATENGILAFDPQDGKFETVCDPEADLPENRFNDGKCDPAGRFWAGTMNLDPLNHSTGALYSFDADFCMRKHLTNVGVSNGIVWSQDAKRMYFIDSMIGTIDCFDYDVESGTICNRRPIFSMPSELGLADGMAIDAEDMLWVAFWGGWCVARIDPTTGSMLTKIELPAANVAACAFGGDDMQDLYITTARHGLSDTELSEQPEAGSLFLARPTVRGAEFAIFGG